MHWHIITIERVNIMVQYQNLKSLASAYRLSHLLLPLHYCISSSHHLKYSHLLMIISHVSNHGQHIPALTRNCMLVMLRGNHFLLKISSFFRRAVWGASRVATASWYILSLCPGCYVTRSVNICIYKLVSVLYFYFEKS